MEATARADAMAHIVGIDQPSPAPPRAAARLSLRSIDIFRGFAAIWIALYHANLFFWRTGEPPIAFGSGRAIAGSISTILLHEGWLGVNLFFVLSGFCIHLPYARRERLDLAEYATRRWLRIWPPYVAAVGLGFLMEVARHTPLRANLLNAFLHLFFWNWSTHPLSPVDQGLNPVFWTITIEVQLYAFYAIGWPLIRRVGVFQSACIFLAFGLAYHVGTELRWPQSAMFNSTAILSQRSFAINRFGEWLLGATVAHWLVNAPPDSARHRSKASLWTLAFGGVAVIVASRLLNDVLFVRTLEAATSGLKRHILEPFYSVGFAMIIAAAVFGEQRAVQTGEASTGIKDHSTGGNPIVLIAAATGLRCYSLYLFHFPMLAITGEIGARMMGLTDADKDALGGSLRWLGVTLSAIIAIVICTELAYRLIELPSHRLARRAAKRLAS